MRLRRCRAVPAPRHLRPIGRLVVMGWLAAGWATGAAAQTYFKWTDSQGVVHFSEAPPPPQTKGVEKLDMPGAPVRSRAVQPAPGATAPAGAPETPPGATAGTPAAARVVLTGRKTPRTGPAALQVSGEVKNVGGGNARDVTVTITVLDSSSGYECLRQEVPVAPATLGAGEVGTFDVDLDSPCLLGQPKLDLTPVWVSADQSE